MLDRQLLELAARQFGVVGRNQLLDELGHSRHQLFRARRSGRLVDILPDVYRVASSPDHFEARCFAAQLHAGGRCFLSGVTAARIHGLRKMPVSRVHLTVPDDRRLRPARWIVVHRSSWYDARRDRTELASGLIVATPMRMLFGLAATFNRFRFERAAEDAWHLGLVDPVSAFDYLQAHRCRGKDGVARLEEWLERALGYNAAAQSELERLTIQEIERLGIPTPERQHPLGLPTGETIHLDIAWPDIRLAVEPGANWFHGGDLRVDRDHARDRACLALGWMIVRFTESMRNDLPAAAHEIRRIRQRRIADLRRAELG